MPKINNKLKVFIENLVIPFILGAALTFVIYSFVARPFVVVGQSMYPTFNTSNSEWGDYLIVELMSYSLGDPKRGDVVVAKGPTDKGAAKYILKRVIGLPNEKVIFGRNSITIEKEDGELYKLKESYINKDTIVTYKNNEVDLKDSEYILLGDNRNNSFDSRSFGIVEREALVGKVLLRLFPINKKIYRPGQTDMYDEI